MLNILKSRPLRYTPAGPEHSAAFVYVILTFKLKGSNPENLLQLL